MREIKFRGYFPGDNILEIPPSWLYGNLIGCDTDTPQIQVPGDYPQYVLPDTVGQYTGARDEDGNEIYEGDIVTDNGYKAEVIWAKTHPCLKYFDDDIHTLYGGHGLRVIGNTHDNPELLIPKKKQ